MKPHIFYFPFSSGVNKYSERIRTILSTITDVSPLSLKEECANLLKLRKRKGGVAVVNWVENMLVSSNGCFSVYGLLKLMFAMITLKIRFDKVIYIQHNLYPHDTNESDIKRVRWCINYLTKIVDITAAHSPHLSSKVYIPHPLYRSPMVSLPANNNFNREDGPYLIFGRIEPYKKIESVIQQFPSNKKLIIAGACSDNNYAKHLMQLVANKPNIVLISRFLSDEEVEAIISRCTAIIISHADPDMIVSGSFFYAITEQLPVLAISSPFLEWAESELGNEIVRTFVGLEKMMDHIQVDNVIDPKNHKFSEKNINKINQMFSDETIIKTFSNLLSTMNIKDY
ncbi:hypothetical protein [Kluyvera ascorbata]|uniref:hypothetical protein n=1 Tax=Kluyvera ascorbata TaxID=51288 RepID=UPI0022E66EEC|nr:hypothetical protein [Kluyvera ascorbata]